MAVKLSSVVVALEANTQKLDRPVAKSTKALGGMKKAAVGLGAALVATFASRKLLKAATDMLKAYAVQEEALVSMRAALEATGRAGTGALDKIAESAARLQKATTKGDEAIIMATASFSQLAGELSVDELVAAQKAMIGIADTFMKGDISNAALIMGKSLTGSTNALVRYGIEIDTTASQGEKLQQILAQSNKFFAVSEARANTLTGRMQQLSNAWGDLKEAVGAFLEQGGALTAFIERLTNVVSDFTTVLLKGNTEQIKRAFQLLGLLAGQAFGVAFLKVIEQAFVQIAIRIPFIFRGVSEALAGLASVATNKIQSLLDDMASAMAELDALAQASVGPSRISVGPGANLVPAAAAGIIAPDIAGAGHGKKMEGFRMPSMKGFHPGLPPAPASIKAFEKGGQLPGVARSMEVVDAAAASFSSAADITVAAFGSMVDAATQGSKSILNTFVNMIGAILQQLSGAGGVSPTFAGILSGVGQVLSFQEGGVVPGTGSGAVTALVHPGETVLPKGAAMQRVTVNQEINFVAEGGFIGPEWWEQNMGYILKGVAEAAHEAPAFARALRG